MRRKIVDFLTAGSSNYNKSPKIKFENFSLSLGQYGKWKGHVFANKLGGFGEGYYCYIKPDCSLSGDMPDWLEKELVLLAENPAVYCSTYGRKTGRCCFCSLELTDPRSVSVGYGEICSNKWFLPWGHVATEPKSAEEPILNEKQQNKEYWDDLKEMYGEIISIVDDDAQFVHKIGATTFFAYGNSIKEIADEYQAYWLLDAIASYQFKARSQPRMRSFQIWELKVDLDKHEGILIGSWDKNKPLYRQRIPYTDYPNRYIKFYLENNFLKIAEQ